MEMVSLALIGPPFACFEGGRRDMEWFSFFFSSRQGVSFIPRCLVHPRRILFIVKGKGGEAGAFLSCVDPAGVQETG